MLIKNWMHTNPITVSSDVLISEVIELMREKDLRFIPVVDEGKLRGIITRRDIREAGSFVIAMQDSHELKFFNERLKVKDLMVRKPITLNVDDTVETALIKGKKFRRKFFPVLDDEKLVGTVSDLDIYNSFYQILGIDENLAGISIEVNGIPDQATRKIVNDLLKAGIEISSFFSLSGPKSEKKRLHLRIKPQYLEMAKKVIHDAGYKILESIRHE